MLLPKKFVVVVLTCCVTLCGVALQAQSTSINKNQPSTASVDKKKKALFNRIQKIDDALSKIPKKIDTSRFDEVAKLIEVIFEKLQLLKKTHDGVMQEKRDLFGEGFSVIIVFGELERNFLNLKALSEAEAISKSAIATHILQKQWALEQESYQASADVAKKAAQHFADLLSDTQEQFKGIEHSRSMIDRLSLSAEEWRSLIKNIEAAEHLKGELDMFAERVNEIIFLFDKAAADTKNLLTYNSYTKKSNKKNSSNSNRQVISKSPTTKDRIRALGAIINKRN